MNWLTLVLLSVFLYSIGLLLQRVLLREEKSDPVSYSIFFQYLTGAMLLLMGFIFSEMSLPSLKPLLFSIVLLTVLYGFGNILVFRGIKQVEASRFTVLFSSRALFTVLGASVFLSEVLTLKQWSGALLVLAGVFYISSEKRFRLQVSRKDWPAIFGAMAFGFANTNDRFLLKTLDPYPYLVMAFVLPAILMSVLKRRKLRKISVFLKRRMFSKMFIISIFYALNAVAFFTALKIAPSASQVGLVNLTGVVVTVILAIIFLKERDNIARKLISAILCFIGVYLIS